MAYIYILASARNGTLYIGMTSDLKKRIFQHKTELIKGFTSQYHIKTLVYYEVYQNIQDAIVAETKLKHLSREKKMKIIERQNPDWVDLYYGL